MRETVKKVDGFPVRRLHLVDGHGDKLVAEVDVEYPAALIGTEQFTFIVLSPSQLRRMADWVERAWTQTEEWRQSEDGRLYSEQL